MKLHMNNIVSEMTYIFSKGDELIIWELMRLVVFLFLWSYQISLEYIPNAPINNIPALA